MAGWSAGVKSFFDSFIKRRFNNGCFIAGFRAAIHFITPSGDGFQISHNELKINNVMVALRIRMTRYVNDVVVFKISDHFGDGVYFANVMKKFITKPFTLVRSRYKTGNIHKFYSGVDYFL